nr:hypothetical protein [Oscillospiraceae bacterium]
NLTPQEVAALRAAATKGKTTATIEKNTERNAKQAARTRGKNAAYAQKGAGKGGKKPAVHSRSAAAPRKGGIIK